MYVCGLERRRKGWKGKGKEGVVILAILPTLSNPSTQSTEKLHLIGPLHFDPTQNQFFFHIHPSN